MAVFVFQSTPERYDLRTAVRVGERDTWYATRYRTEVSPGNSVYFWMAGDDNFRGLYGWGHLASEPYIKESWNAHGIDVVYDYKFTRPILAKKIRDNSQLSRLLIFRAPQATNFLL